MECCARFWRKRAADDLCRARRAPGGERARGGDSRAAQVEGGSRPASPESDVGVIVQPNGEGRGKRFMRTAISEGMEHRAWGIWQVVAGSEPPSVVTQSIEGRSTKRRASRHDLTFSVFRPHEHEHEQRHRSRLFLHCRQHSPGREGAFSQSHTDGVEDREKQ